MAPLNWTYSTPLPTVEESPPIKTLADFKKTAVPIAKVVDGWKGDAYTRAQKQSFLQTNKIVEKQDMIIIDSRTMSPPIHENAERKIPDLEMYFMSNPRPTKYSIHSPKYDAERLEKLKIRQENTILGNKIREIANRPCTFTKPNELNARVRSMNLDDNIRKRNQHILNIYNESLVNAQI